MQIRHRILGVMMVVTLEGELDQYSASYVKDYLDSLFSDIKVKQIVFDLSELAFMDSTGIGVFIGRYKKMKQRGVPIYICNPSNHAQRIFDISGLYKIIPLIS